MTTKIKKCGKCGIEKPISEFSKCPSHSDGLQSVCKECVNIYNKIYFRKNRERLLVALKLYREINCDKVREQKHRCYINKIRHYSEKRKKYYSDNKDALRATQKKYMQTARGKAVDARVKHKRRSKERSSPNTLNERQWMKIIILQNNKCSICGVDFTPLMPPTRDHIIPVSKGGGLTLGNTQALCHSCNCKKSASVNISKAISELLIEV